MKALHTADWHIGQTLNGWSREAEHEAFLAQLSQILVEEEIDLLLVAGDVFDNSNPSGESQRLLYQALADFKRQRPGLTIVISGGNHDPALRLEAAADLIEGFDIHVIGTMRRHGGEIDINAHLIPVTGPDGTPLVYVLAIPFLRAADLTGLNFTEDGQENSISNAVRRFHADLTEKAAVIAQNTPLIATGHIHCAGGLESEGAERRILIGGAHAVPPEVFPERLDYVALGHLHCPQNLAGGRVRYSGSGFPLSASEINYRHGVTILDIDGRNIATWHREVSRPAPVLRIPATGTTNLASLAVELAKIAPITPPALRPLVYVELEAEDAPAVMMGKAEALLREAPVRPAGLRIHRPQSAQVGDAPAPLIALTETTPEALFISAFEEKNGFAPEARHLAAFRDVVGEV